MLVMQIYESGDRIAEKAFQGQFSIVEQDGELHWLADDEPGPGRGCDVHSVCTRGKLCYNLIVTL
jgi:hypothetical protein